MDQQAIGFLHVDVFAQRGVVVIATIAHVPCRPTNRFRRDARITKPGAEGPLTSILSVMPLAPLTLSAAASAGCFSSQPPFRQRHAAVPGGLADMGGMDARPPLSARQAPLV